MARPSMRPPKSRVRPHFGASIPRARPIPYRVLDGDSWASLARKFEMDAKNLIWFNFKTTVRPEINWYLYNYVGCRTPSPRGKSWSFSSRDQPGIIWIPLALSGSSPTPKKAKEPSQDLDAPDTYHESGSAKYGFRRLTAEGASRLVESGSKKARFVHQRGFHRYVIQRGLVVPTAEGERLVLKVSSYTIVFLLDGKFYVQDRGDFVEDIAMGADIEGARGAKGMMRLVELEMKFFMGLASVTSGVGFIAVTTAKIGEFATENDISALVRKVMALRGS